VWVVGISHEAGGMSPWYVFETREEADEYLDTIRAKYAHGALALREVERK